MPEFAYVFNKQNELVLWNKNIELILGYSKDELYKKDAYDFMEESVREENQKAIDSVFSYKEEQSIIVFSGFGTCSNISRQVITSKSPYDPEIISSSVDVCMYLTLLPTFLP